MFGRSSGRIDLPSIPVALARVIQVTNRADATADDVARVVMLDQSLATKVLRLANSAYYGRRRKSDTVTDAVVTLGFSAVRNLAASASVVDALFPRQMFPGFSWPDMWVHSVTCAIATEAIYAQSSRRSAGKSETAFVAGLLHDVGKLVVARALPMKFTSVVHACLEYGMEMARAEHGILGTDHAKIGSDLTREWDFPESLRESISYHHDPDCAIEHADLAAAVHAGDLLAKRMSKSYVVGQNVDIALKQVADAGRVPLNQMEYIVNEVRDSLHDCVELLSWAKRMPGGEIAFAA